jgi:hypothetical protein
LRVGLGFPVDVELDAACLDELMHGLALGGHAHAVENILAVEASKEAWLPPLDSRHLAGGAHPRLPLPLFLLFPSCCSSVSFWGKMLARWC